MARTQVSKPNITFINGLVTESSKLAPAENTVRDCDNIDIELNGKARRRYGLMSLGNNFICNGLDPDGVQAIENRVAEIHEWPSPGGDSTKHFTVIRDGLTFHVFDNKEDSYAFMQSGLTSQLCVAAKRKIVFDPTIPYSSTYTETAPTDVVYNPVGNARWVYSYVWAGGGGGSSGGVAGGGGAAGVKKITKLNYYYLDSPLYAITSDPGTGGAVDADGVDGTITDQVPLHAALVYTAGGGKKGVGGTGGAGGLIVAAGDYNAVGEAGDTDGNGEGGDAGTLPIATGGSVPGGLGGAIGVAGSTPGGGGGENAAGGAGVGYISVLNNSFGYTATFFATVGLSIGLSEKEMLEAPLDSYPGQGRLWFTGKGMFCFSLKYDKDTDTIEEEIIGFHPKKYPFGHAAMREIRRLGSTALNSTEPDSTTVDAAHIYNLLNAGWTSVAINDYYTAHSVYPALSMQYWRGRDTTGDFDPTLLRKYEFGDAAAPCGRFLIDIYREYRDNTRTHTIGLPAGANTPASPLAVGADQDDYSKHGFETVCFAYGRLFLAGDGKGKNTNGLHFSQVVQAPEDAGKFYSVQDPTSEFFPDALATDGGVVYIPEAGGIKKVRPFSGGILVFALKGVWFVHSANGAFSPLTIGRTKLSSEGVESQAAVVETEGGIYYASGNGVYTVTLRENYDLPVVENISEQRINTFYKAINPAAWNHARVRYDNHNKTVGILYLDAESAVHASYSNLYNKLLLLDTRTGSFRPYSFTYSLEAGAFHGVKDITTRNRKVRQRTLEPLVDSAGDVVLDANDNTVYTQNEDSEETFHNEFLLLLGQSSDEERLYVCGFNDPCFVDWRGTAVCGAEYSSYLETEFDNFGDIERYKQATYVFSYFEQTEKKWYKIDAGNELVLSYPSRCLMTAQWEWHENDGGNRWSDPQDAYFIRLQSDTTPVLDEVLDIGSSVVWSKLKARGKGKSLALRYESVTSKDFRLLGYSIPVTAPQTP